MSNVIPFPPKSRLATDLGPKPEESRPDMEVGPRLKRGTTTVGGLLDNAKDCDDVLIVGMRNGILSVSISGDDDARVKRLLWESLAALVRLSEAIGEENGPRPTE